MHRCRARSHHWRDELPWTGVSPYGISYRSIIPREEECSNLLVPVCISASHSACGSIRLEPVYMMLGESAATAACLALDAGVSLQKLDYPTLRHQLVGDKTLRDP